jgi:phospholipase C
MRSGPIFGLFLTMVILAGCSGGATTAPNADVVSLLPPAEQAASTDFPDASTSPIKHVVIMIQENRSYDNLFATFPGADGTTKGLTHTGAWIPLIKAPLVSTELDHAYSGFVTEYDHGKMDGFDLTRFGSSGQLQAAGTYPYRYVDPAQIQPYWTMAKQYVLLDHLFQTQASGSYTAHQDLIAGGTAINPTESIIDWPSRGPFGCDAPAGTVTSLITNEGQYLFNQGPFPCLTYKTLRDLLDAKKLSWKYYVGPLTNGSTGFIWNAFDSIKAVRDDTSEWCPITKSMCPKTNVSVPETNVFHDISKNKLPAVSWVIPDAQNSDHASASDTGPSWVAQVVNAIGESPAWKSTAIIVLWDDWGGFYDHVPPPKLGRSDGPGFRVPVIIVSPYPIVNHICSAQFEFGSILRFVEGNWNLGTLGTTDATAASIRECFYFHQPPRKFVRIKAKYSRAFFEHEVPSGLPVDTE